MNLLVLGGTAFLGRHIVERAISLDHRVTLFNRGQRNPDLFADVPQLRGDRNGDVSALAGKSFDAVIDCCGYTAEQMTRTADVLAGNVRHYVFVSTISVYEQFAPGAVFDEGAAIAVGNEGYGPQKARAEEAIERACSGRVTHVRPGLIVGPHDPTGRFTYWPRRFMDASRQTRVLAPGRPQQSIQWIDVRDLAQFCIHVAENKIAGRFNAVTPPKTIKMSQLLEACRAAAHSNATIEWMSDEALLAANVAEWTDLPLWLAQSNETHGGMMLADSSRAVSAGLTFAAIEDTVRATMQWCVEFPNVDAATRVTTITPEREAELLRSIPAPPLPAT
jgi:2'-hydroxyisoflavone reductase